jgi:SAM-dependent methyltransferase
MPQPASRISHRTPTGQPSAWVRRFAPAVKKGGRVLDLACGNGRHARIFLELGYEVTLVDKDLSRVQDLIESGKAEAIEADLEGGNPWPLPGRRFDAVVVVNYLHRPLFADLLRAVAPDGYLIYETFAEGNEWYGRPRAPEFLLKPGELLEVCGKELTVVAFEQGLIELAASPAIKQFLCARRNPHAEVPLSPTH